MDKKNNNGGVQRKVAACDVEALKKCLAEQKGDYAKCQAQIEAFKSSCTLKNKPPTPSYSLSPRPRPNSNPTSNIVTEI